MARLGGGVCYICNEVLTKKAIHTETVHENHMAFNPALDLVFAQRGWLSKQQPEARRSLLERGRRVAFDAGETIVSIGDGLGGIYGIISGAVGTIGMTEFAGPTLGHIMRPGFWFGEGPLVAQSRRTMTFRAMEETELVLVPLSEIRPLIAADAAFAAMIAKMSHEGHQSTLRVACELLINDAPSRLGAVLLRVTAVLEGITSAYPQGFRISQTDLAEMTGLSRNHTNRILNDLQAQGLVTLSYNHIQINRPDDLAAHVRRGNRDRD